jgi:futalosine hydrolase
MKCKCEIWVMKILLVSATEIEIAPFISSNSDIDVCVTGVGTPQCMYRLQQQLQQTNYNMVIQAGIAGTFNTAFNLGQTVLVKYDTFADIGFEENEKFTSLFDSGFAKKNDFPFTGGWLKNDHPYLVQSNLAVATAITINKVSDSKLQTLQMSTAYNAEVESMEGAAFHYVCLQNNIDFLQVRSISNHVADRNKLNWKMTEAIVDLNKNVALILNDLKK